MKPIKHTRRIAAPVEFLFDYSQRNSCRMDWDPFVVEVHLHDDHDLPAAGTVVTVRTWCGMGMTCRYIQFRRPECIAIRMTEGPRVLASFGGSWRFESLADGGTQVTFNYAFTLKRSCRCLAPLARLYFSWDMARRLRALRRGAERAFSRYTRHGVLPWQVSDAGTSNSEGNCCNLLREVKS